MENKAYKESLKNYSMSLTVPEVAEIMRVSTKLVYKLIKNKTLFAVKVGRENRIPKPVLITYMRTGSCSGLNPMKT
jgi:excisionase family DNA binding protein